MSRAVYCGTLKALLPYSADDRQRQGGNRCGRRREPLQLILPEES